MILVTYYLMITSLEGFALRGKIPPAIAIWTPNVVFAAAGLALVATAREWKWPAMPFVWRGLDALRRAAPSRGPKRVRVHAAGAGRDSTHIIDRYRPRVPGVHGARARGGGHPS